ncbi:MAG TPA: ATP-binding protein [Roseiflexaceae bacterium]|nr:ATP-binding protein [Roseiflexaceae bacterium]
MYDHHVDRDAFRAIDSLPIRDTSIDLLDLDQVAAHVAQARERGRYRGPEHPYDYLLYKRCLVASEGTVMATPAGILCFGYNPQDIFPRAVVDLAHYHGVDPVSFEVAHLEKDIGGTIFDQIARVENYLWLNTHHGMTLDGSSSQRVEVHEYPRAVIRELGVNMIVHRDYANVHSASRVLLFRDRIEWTNPGGLPAGLTIQDILGAQAARNPVILSILYESGYVEAIGQGIDTVITVLHREGMQQPHFEDTGAFFRVMVYGKTMDQFSDAQLLGRLTERQRRILGFIRVRDEVAPSEIEDLLGQSVTVRSIQRDLKVLQDAELIQATGSGRGRGIRYRIRS